MYIGKMELMKYDDFYFPVGVDLNLNFKLINDWFGFYRIKKVW